MQFANFFFEEIEKKPELAETKICIHAFDISTNEIPISEQLKNSEQIRIVPHPGVSCGNSSGFQTESFDFIVSTLALFGNEDSWKKSIQTAFFALKINFTILFTDRFSEVMSSQQMLEFKTLHETFNPLHL